MGFKVTVTKKRAGVFYLLPMGSMDIESCPDFEKALAPILVSSTKAIIINMAGVDYIGSMGIRQIMTARNKMEELGGCFFMTNLRPQVRKIFDILHVLPLVNVFASVDEAEEYLASMNK